MNIQNLWIGDNVRILSKNENGVFEGISKQGFALIKVSDQVLKVSGDDLILIEESKVENPALIEILQESKSKQKPRKEISNKIDLHIEQLAPHLVNAPPSRILDFQIERCIEFIETSIASKQGIIHIIHGKGKGVLKAAVIDILKSNNQINFYTEASQGGALDVWLR